MNNGIFDFPTSLAQSPYALLGRPSSVPMIDYKTPLFDPRDFQGLQIWLDASDRTTIFDRTDGGSLPNDKNPVALWVDKGPNSNPFIQATPSNRPIRKSQQLNSLDGIYFDGSNDFLYRNLNVFDTTVSVLVVADFDNNTSRRAIIDLNIAGGTFQHFTIEQNTFQTVGNRYGFYASNTSLDSDCVTSSGVKLFCVIANTTVGNSIINNTIYRINGISRTLTIRAGGGSYANYTTTNGVGLGDFNVDGGGGGIRLAGHIYEVIVYNILLSSNQINTIENYLIKKWRIPLQ